MQDWWIEGPLFSYATKLPLEENKIHVQFDFGGSSEAHFGASLFAHEALFGVKGS
jgi:hypothetical protein